VPNIPELRDSYSGVAAPITPALEDLYSGVAAPITRLWGTFIPAWQRLLLGVRGPLFRRGSAYSAAERDLFRRNSA
jgi:hypothetical protein